MTFEAAPLPERVTGCGGAQTRLTTRTGHRLLDRLHPPTGDCVCDDIADIAIRSTEEAAAVLTAH